MAPVTGVIHRSSDGGASWEHLTVSPGDPIETITAAPDGSTYALSERGRILRSTDQGGTWTDVGRINRQNWGWERALYAGPDDDLLFLKMNGSLWRSADSGGNWTQVVLVSDAADSPIREPEAFHLTTLQDGTLLAGTNYGVYRSDDAGLTWEHHSAGLQTPHINIVAEDPQDGTLYAGTSAGVYRSNDGGLN